MAGYRLRRHFFGMQRLLRLQGAQCGCPLPQHAVPPLVRVASAGASARTTTGRRPSEWHQRHRNTSWQRAAGVPAAASSPDETSDALRLLGGRLQQFRGPRGGRLRVVHRRVPKKRALGTGGGFVGLIHRPELGVRALRRGLSKGSMAAPTLHSPMLLRGLRWSLLRRTNAMVLRTSMVLRRTHVIPLGGRPGIAARRPSPR
mmetsp:Transcript_20571/g.57390  ORF Transcript_20571/g.57390 Transcript_20571/m.57390 type:complete len:202 (-) Transcript_20571:508-1113(-)